MQKCMESLKAGGGEDPNYGIRKKEEILQQYEDTLKHTYVVPQHGIQPVNLECVYPVKIGKLPDLECREEDSNEICF